MTPIDFVIFQGDSSPNTPAYLIAEAMNRYIEIRSADGDWEVLSYSYDSDCGKMVLDIQRKK